ncbi:tyrosine-type recombinase/integrase [Fusobacterium sp. PH5-44]|uniref:tyrosine-type recombinase/integrase n=1 Tax=unclassified Fusobacterium TaxID=2648384 RepID=UPI003D22839F
METKGQEVKYLKDKDLERIRVYLNEKEKVVFLSFINIGVNVGLRISDLGRLKFEEIKSDYSIDIKEQKTGKKRCILLNRICQETIEKLKEFYIKLGYSITNGYIFKSLSTYNKKFKIDAPYVTNNVARHFKKTREALGIQYPIGSHSLRKTWGNRVYRKTKDIGLLMRAFGHSSAEQTLKYIGIEEEDIRNIYKNFEI